MWKPLIRDENMVTRLGGLGCEFIGIDFSLGNEHDDKPKSR